MQTTFLGDYVHCICQLRAVLAEQLVEASVMGENTDLASAVALRKVNLYVFSSSEIEDTILLSNFLSDSERLLLASMKVSFPVSFCIATTC